MLRKLQWLPLLAARGAATEPGYCGTVTASRATGFSSTAPYSGTVHPRHIQDRTPQRSLLLRLALQLEKEGYWALL